MFLLDTNVISELRRPERAAVSWCSMMAPGGYPFVVEHWSPPSFDIHFSLKSELGGQAEVKFGKTTVLLVDDGTLGDSVAGDGLYEQSEIHQLERARETAADGSRRILQRRGVQENG